MWYGWYARDDGKGISRTIRCNISQESISAIARWSLSCRGEGRVGWSPCWFCMPRNENGAANHHVYRS